MQDFCCELAPTQSFCVWRRGVKFADFEPVYLNNLGGSGVRGCIDVDECELREKNPHKPPLCPVGQRCVNTDGLTFENKKPRPAFHL